MDYQNESTRILATRCCACGRQLRDAESVRMGIGPVCRGHAGHEDSASREEANRLVHAIACARRMTAEQAGRLATLGYGVLAAKIVCNLQTPIDTITIERETHARLGEVYVVEATYREEALAAWRRIRRWDSKRKVNLVPLGCRAALWQIIQRFYPGTLLAGGAVKHRVTPAQETNATQT